MKTIELLHDETKDKSLVLILRDDDTVQEYVIATHYNVNGERYEQWAYGAYFTTLERALNCWNEKVLDRLSYERLSELATLFKDGLVEDDVREAYEYFDETCEMTTEEYEYFGLAESEEEEEWTL